MKLRVRTHNPVTRLSGHHGDGTEEVVFDSRVSGTDLPTATG